MPQSDATRFACRFDGCPRSFSRHEHLQRHILNHADGEFTCERCRTVFKRPDLLGMPDAQRVSQDVDAENIQSGTWPDIVEKTPRVQR